MAFALSYFFSSKKKREVREEIAETGKTGLPKAVIIGGGHAGAKMATKLDSIFDVVLIDSKNYLNNNGHATIGEILTSNLIEESISKLGDADKTDQEAKKIYHSCFPLHRFYLKRANVVVGNVEEVKKESVVVRKKHRAEEVFPGLNMLKGLMPGYRREEDFGDVFTIPYDLLFFATGEQLAFPFHSTTYNRQERIKELQDFSKFLQLESVRKVAIVGGGPCGVSLTKMLSQHFNDVKQPKEFHIFSSSSSLLPSMPKQIQKKAYGDLQSQKNVSVHLKRKVISVEDGADRSIPFQWITNIIQKVRKTPTISANACKKYTVAHVHAPCSTSFWEHHRERSLLHHLFYGKHDNPYRSKPTSACTVTDSTDSCDRQNFDYIFDCTGATPRVDSPLLSGEKKNDFFSITEHLNEDGYFRVNRFFQLYSHPNIFAIGRCVATSSNYFARNDTEKSGIEPQYDFGQKACKTHSLSTSDCQVDYVFNHILSMISSSDSAVHGFAEQNIRGFPYYNNFFHYWPPQLMIPFGKESAVGVLPDYPQMHFPTPFTSSFEISTGIYGRFFLDKERQQHCKVFAEPRFYRQKDPIAVRRNFDLWIENVKVSPQDFHM